MNTLLEKLQQYNTKIANKYIPKQWQEAIDDGYANRRYLFKKLFGTRHTIQIPIVYSVEPTMIQYLPDWMKDLNKITEDAKYFVIGNNKFKKLAFLNEFLAPGKKEEVALEMDTTGMLVLTINPYLYSLCSDPRFCSWTSCYSPKGCYYSCMLQIAASDSIMMALIVNSDASKIIGRRFVAIPTNGREGSLRPAIASLKHYGTFPTHYQRSLTDYIIENLFDDSKANWSQVPEGDIENMSSQVRLTNNDNGNGWGYDNGDYEEDMWMDPAKYFCHAKSLFSDVFPTSYLVLHGGNSLDDDDDEDGECCDYCGEYFSELYEIYRGDPEAGHSLDYCEYCRSEYASYSERCQAYIHDNNSVRYYNNDSLDIDFTYEGDNGLVDVWFINTDNVDCDPMDSGSWELFDGEPSASFKNDGDICVFANDFYENTTNLRDAYLDKIRAEEGDNDEQSENIQETT